MRPHILKINGRVVTRQEFEAVKIDDTLLRGTPRVQGYCDGREERSIAMSVNPDQIPEMNAEIERRGIKGVYYDPNHTHNCRITSKEGRNQWMKIYGKLTGMHGMHDVDGGYNDP